jgi:cellulose biosynthesis protein BcsQ
MQVLALHNPKGGVGKTAAAVNLAALSGRSGYRTLLVDLDAQGAASFYLNAEPAGKWTSKRLAKGGKHLRKAALPTDYRNLDVLPASPSLRRLALVLDDAKHSRRRLSNVLGEFAASYDLLVLDTPATLDLVAENIFRAADIILVPIIPTTLSVATLSILDEFLTERDPTDTTVRLYFSMVDGRKRLHLETVERLRSLRGDILETRIPFASEIEQMGLRRAPLTARPRKSKSAQAFEALWEEIRRFLDAETR